MPEEAIAEIHHTLELLHSLEQILEHEFNALKEQDLDAFDGLQDRKVGTLEAITNQGGIAELSSSPTVNPQRQAELREKIKCCHDLHRRNEILIKRKLDAVKNALSTLKNTRLPDPETYTRRGLLE
jgi:flagellar biosynthesis/type III secretory pathway chaperone